MKVINFHGGPGVGKSTASTGLVHCLKKCHVIADYAPEFAKDLIYAGSAHTLADQKWVFANQDHRLHVLRSHVDIAVCDSPLILSAHYGGRDISTTFRRHVMETFFSYDNLNYFIDRNPSFEFQQEGRLHNATESDIIANELKELLDKAGAAFKTITAGNELPERVFADLAQSRAIEIPASGAREAIKLMRRAAEYDEVLRARMSKQSLLDEIAEPKRSNGRPLSL